jgi:hypothetical protein
MLEVLELDPEVLRSPNNGYKSGAPYLVQYDAALPPLANNFAGGLCRARTPAEDSVSIMDSSRVVSRLSCSLEPGRSSASVL